jgi:hypothetical protein
MKPENSEARCALKVEISSLYRNKWFAWGAAKADIDKVCQYMIRQQPRICEPFPLSYFFWTSWGCCAHSQKISDLRSSLRVLHGVSVAARYPSLLA